jgi:hypothetical protein
MPIARPVVEYSTLTSDYNREDVLSGSGLIVMYCSITRSTSTSSCLSMYIPRLYAGGERFQLALSCWRKSCEARRDVMDSWHGWFIS